MAMENKWLEETCGSLRSDIEALKKRVLNMLAFPVEVEADITEEVLNEMKANTKLSYRHLEDSRMRLGKVLQAYQGGVSIYDKGENKGDNEGDEAT